MRQVVSLSARRAWIEMPDSTHRREPFPSLSARRAWIEMRVNEDRYGQQYVALRKESVDRNVFGFGAKLIPRRSLSARRAWIEISKTMYHIT